MRRFVFPLEALLRLKRQREQMAELQLATAQAAFEKARIHAASLREQLDQHATTAAERVGRVTTATDWTGAMDVVNRLQVSIQAADRGVDEARTNVEAARKERVKWAIEVETLVTLRDKQLEEHRHLEQHETQVRLDDLTLRRWQSNKNGLRPSGGMP